MNFKGRYKTWLYAGNSEYPALPVKRDYVLALTGDNATGADNQQERPGPLVRESSETTRQALSAGEQSKELPSEMNAPKMLSDDIVRPPWRHGEISRNGLSRNNKPSFLVLKFEIWNLEFNCCAATILSVSYLPWAY